MPANRHGQAIDFTLADRRDIFRDAVFLCRTPLVTPRMTSGCADRNASAAADWSPEAIASSTLRKNVRMRERRAVLIVFRRAFCLARFFD